MFLTLQPSDQKAPLYKRVESHPTLLVTSATSLSLVTNNWYTGKVVIDDDPGNSALQRLRFWVDTDDDADFSDETELMGGSGTTTIDDTWSGGYVGLYRGGGAAQQYDDFKIGYDNNADGDFDDGGDVIAIDDDFSSNTINLTYDANGNLTHDGIFQFSYDAWNRLRQAKLVVGADETTVGDYAYYGDTRRSKKIVSNHGPEAYLNDGGDTETRFYYAGWRPAGDVLWRRSAVETRNGLNNTVQAVLLGKNYETVGIELNGDNTLSNDTNPDETASGESGELPDDRRYFVSDDQHGNITLVTDYGSPNNGRVAERRCYAPGRYNSFFAGDNGYGEHGAVSVYSLVGASLDLLGDFTSLPGLPDARDSLSQGRRCPILLRASCPAPPDPDPPGQPKQPASPPTTQPDNPCQTEEACCTCILYTESRSTQGCYGAMTCAMQARQGLSGADGWRGHFGGEGSYCAQAESGRFKGARSKRTGPFKGDYKKCCDPGCVLALADARARDRAREICQAGCPGGSDPTNGAQYWNATCEGVKASLGECNFGSGEPCSIIPVPGCSQCFAKCTSPPQRCP